MSAEQLTIFDLLNQEEALPRNIKLLSLFSGIGAFEKALYNLGINCDLIGYCEKDRHASRSYSVIHDVTESMNLWDVTEVDEKTLPKNIDLLTYGFPCQDISLAGKQKGLMYCEECYTENEIPDDYVKRANNGEKFYCKKCGTELTLTRSGLFFDALRIIEETKPRVAMAENVKNLTGKKFNAQFQVVLASLEAAGYNNYWAVLNLMDFGVPQNRERVFIVSIRKDLDKGLFEFPKGFPLNKCLRDVMEAVVDEKYFLDGKYESILKVNEHYSLLCGGKIGKMHDISRRVYSSEYVAPSLHTCGGGNQEPKVFQPRVLAGVGEKKSNGGKQWYQQDRIYDNNIAISVTTSFNPYYLDANEGRPRKLTPSECFRLMGFDDSDFHKAELVNSNTQLYKQAGNSIGVPVIEYIIKQLLKCEIWE